MKELQDVIKDAIGIFSEQEKKKELKLISRLRPHRGHKCWELNMQTGEIAEAVFVKQDASFLQALNGGYSINKKVVVKENCVYTTALNKANAKKHFIKILSRVS